MANALSTGVMGVGIPTFLGLSKAGFRTDGNTANNSYELTAAELFDILKGGTGGIHHTFGNEGRGGANLPNVMFHNIKRNWMSMGLQVIGIPIIAKMATKVLRKPVLTPANKLLKQVGLTDVKV